MKDTGKIVDPPSNLSNTQENTVAHKNSLSIGFDKIKSRPPRKNTLQAGGAALVVYLCVHEKGDYNVNVGWWRRMDGEK